MLPLMQSLSLKGPASASKLDHARGAFGRAVAIDRTLMGENPSVDAYRADFLTASCFASLAEDAAGHRAESMVRLTEARDASSIATTPDRAVLLGPPTVEILLLSAFADSREGRVQGALGSVDEAGRRYRSMTAAGGTSKAVIEYQELNIETVRAMVFWEAGRPAEAAPHWDRATAIAPTPARPLVAYFGEMHRAEAPLRPPARPGESPGGRCPRVRRMRGPAPARLEPRPVRQDLRPRRRCRASGRPGVARSPRGLPAGEGPRLRLFPRVAAPRPGRSRPGLRANPLAARLLRSFASGQPPTARRHRNDARMTAGSSESEGEAVDRGPIGGGRAGGAASEVHE